MCKTKGNMLNIFTSHISLTLYRIKIKPKKIIRANPFNPCHPRSILVAALLR